MNGEYTLYIVLSSIILHSIMVVSALAYSPVRITLLAYNLLACIS